MATQQDGDGKQSKQDRVLIVLSVSRSADIVTTAVELT